METEDADIAQAPSQATMKQGTHSLRRIFDNADAGFFSDFADRTHVRHATVKINGNDGTRTRREARLEAVGRETPRVRIDVCENGCGSNVLNWCSRSDPRDIRNYYFIPRTNPQSGECEVDSRRT